MPSAPPPGRYRVVEKGRRLVVVDMLTGEAATREPPTSSAAPVSDVRSLANRLPSVPRVTSFDGRSTLLTHPFYDLKGPRTVDFDPGATVLLGRLQVGAAVVAALFVAAVVFEPWLLVLPPFILFQPKLLNGLRERVTRWLDRYATGSSAG